LREKFNSDGRDLDIEDESPQDGGKVNTKLDNDNKEGNQHNHCI
jgi:hypothetical protein